MTIRHVIALIFTCSCLGLVACGEDGSTTVAPSVPEAQRWSVGEAADPSPGRSESPDGEKPSADRPAEPGAVACDATHPCEAASLNDQASWPSYWRGFEQEVIALINSERAAGADCGGSRGVQPPAAPVEESALLREAARLHAADLARHNRLAHEGSDGSVFWERARATNYEGTPEGEAVAGGYPTPAEVVESWMTSPDHCAVVMLSHPDEIGVGYVFRRESSYGHFWSLTMGQRTVR